jgi:hypothetical protein
LLGRSQVLKHGLNLKVSASGSKRLLSSACALLLALALVPVAAPNALGLSSGATIDLSDSSTASGAGWTYDSSTRVFTISDGADVVVKGSTKVSISGGVVAYANAVAIAANATAIVTLYNASISTSMDPSPIVVGSGATLNLKLKGTNSITSYYTAIHVPPTATLNITSANGDDSVAGVLNVKSSEQFGATVGGRYNESSGAITINGGSVSAINEHCSGAAIGGSSQGGADITINGGAVYASQERTGCFVDGAARNGSAIGGGNGTTKPVSVTITGGSVYAVGIAAAIGDNGESTSTTVNISGGVVVAVGHSASGDTWSISATSGSITGGTVIATANSEITASGGGTLYTDIVYSSIERQIGNSSVPSGNITLGSNLTIPQGARLYLPVGEFDIPAGVTLTNEGTIYNPGALLVSEGILLNNGDITDDVTVLDGSLGGANVSDVSQTLPPAPPSNLSYEYRYSSDGNVNIRLKWDFALGDVSYYQVSVVPNGNADNWVVASNGSYYGAAVKETDVTTPAATLYNFKVRSVRNGMPSDAVSTTDTVYGVPSYPKNLTVTNNTTAEVTLTWETPEYNGGSPITGYEYSIDDKNYIAIPGSTATTTTFTVPHAKLIKGIVNYIYIRANNSYGVGERANVSVTPEATDAPPIVTGVSYSDPGYILVAFDQAMDFSDDNRGTFSFSPAVNDAGYTSSYGATLRLRASTTVFSVGETINLTLNGWKSSNGQQMTAASIPFVVTSKLTISPTAKVWNVSNAYSNTNLTQIFTVTATADPMDPMGVAVAASIEGVDKNSFEVVSSLSKSNLSESDGLTATISVRPKPGLSAGTYDDAALVITEGFSNRTQTKIPLSVVVAPPTGLNELSVLTKKYLVSQVMDTQRSPAYPVAGLAWTLYGFKYPFNDALGGQPSAAVYETGDYFQFFLAADASASDVKLGLRLYNVNGVLKNTYANSGKIYQIFSGGFAYIGANRNYGYIIFDPPATSTSVTVYPAAAPGDAVGLDDMLNNKTLTIATDPVAAAITYGQSLSASVITPGVVKQGTTSIPGVYFWKDDSIKPMVSDSNSTSYMIIFIPTDTVKYNPVEIPVRVTVARKQLTTFVNVLEKSYDGTQVANVSVVLDSSVIIAGDSVVASATGTFNNATAGNNKPVAISGYRLSGASANNYALPLILPNTGSANIKKATISALQQSDFVKTSLAGTYTYDLRKFLQTLPSPRIYGVTTYAYSSIVDTRSIFVDAPSITEYTLTFNVASISEVCLGYIYFTVASENYKTIVARLEVETTEKTPLDISASGLTDLIYTGVAFTPNPEFTSNLKGSDEVFDAAGHYTVLYSPSEVKDVGEYIVSVTVEPTDGFLYVGKETFALKVLAADAFNSNSLPNGLYQLEVGGNISDLIPALPSTDIAGGWSFESGTPSTDGTYTVMFVPDDTDNYNTQLAEISVRMEGVTTPLTAGTQVLYSLSEDQLEIAAPDEVAGWIERDITTNTAGGNVTISGEKLIFAKGDSAPDDYTFTVKYRLASYDYVEVTYSVLLALPEISVSASYEFSEYYDSAVVQNPTVITVHSIGNAETGALSAVLSGDNKDAFSLNQNSIYSVANDETNSELELTYASGLAAGSYEATLTIGNDNLNAKELALSLVVLPRQLIATANNVEKIAGTKDPVLKFTLTDNTPDLVEPRPGGLVGNDELLGGLVRVVGEKAGNYAIESGTLAAPSDNYVLTVVTADKRLTITENETVEVPLYKEVNGRDSAERDGGGVIIPSIPAGAPQDALTVNGAGQIVPVYALADDFAQNSEKIAEQKNMFPTLALVARDKTTVYIESKDLDSPLNFDEWINTWADFFAYSEATYLGRFYIQADESGRPYFTGSDLSRLTYEEHQLALYAVDGTKEAYGTWQNEAPDAGLDDSATSATGGTVADNPTAPPLFALLLLTLGLAALLYCVKKRDALQTREN